MIMEVNFGIDVLCILILLVLNLSIRLDERDSRSASLFKATVICSTLFIMIDLLFNYLIEIDAPNFALGTTHFVNVLAEFGAYSLLCMYYFSVYDELGNWKSWKMRFILVIGALLIVLTLLSLYDGSALDFNSKEVTVADVVAFMTAFPLIPILLDSIVRAARSVFPADRTECLMFSFFVLFPIAASFILSEVVKNFTIECIGITFCLTFLSVYRTNRSIVTDPYSGFKRRFLMMPYIENSFKKRSDGPGTVVAVTDADRFKVIVDTVGHSNATKPLVEIAEAIKSAIKGQRCMVFSSIGSADEMFIIMDRGTREQMEEIRRKIDENLEKKNKELPYELHVSTGIAVQTPETESPQQLFDEADADMYARKQAYYTEKGYTRRK